MFDVKFCCARVKREAIAMNILGPDASDDFPQNLFETTSVT
jgi:hypothetical protein